MLRPITMRRSESREGCEGSEGVHSGKIRNGVASAATTVWNSFFFAPFARLSSRCTEKGGSAGQANYSNAAESVSSNSTACFCVRK
jgi:hypothetical protein